MEIKLTPEELRTSAVQYTQGSQQVTEVLNRLTQEQQVIRANWSGSAFDSFDNQFSELTPKIQQFSQLLEDINTQLNKVASIIEETDSTIASQINA
ncbi:WXG100 family type VII secretion target [Streptococcus sp. DD13]|uniref:WXG100 family type VII secretion target n=1 Tax=Streptococcus sp. DD13 TaxID=1777881 RepID=UPI00079C24C6|nr:WXG100 family type VII secretion target [Streptococcus sp. DD13]KXT77711.1 ESAT-6/Esx family secreted protein EsxA/YukE [Streptococcus sp. DD13]